MLFAHSIVPNSAALRRFEQYYYAKNTAQYGSRGLWLHVMIRYRAESLSKMNRLCSSLIDCSSYYSAFNSPWSRPFSCSLLTISRHRHGYGQTCCHRGSLHWNVIIRIPALATPHGMSVAYAYTHPDILKFSLEFLLDRLLQSGDNLHSQLRKGDRKKMHASHRLYA